MSDAMVQAVTIIGLIIQYLLRPENFMLTFLLPAAVFLIRRSAVWLSIPLTGVIVLMARWGEFTYYESRGLMILFTASQLAVMALFILILKSIRVGRAKGRDRFA